VATNFSFTLTDCANFWTKSPEMAVGSHSSRGRASNGSVLFVVVMRFRRLFRTFCPEIRRQEILLLGPTWPAIKNGALRSSRVRKLPTSWRVSLLSPSLQGRCTQVGSQVRNAARQDTILVFKLVPMEQAGTLGDSRARIAPAGRSGVA
jgi:hypothetical protein